MPRVQLLQDDDDIDLAGRRLRPDLLYMDRGCKVLWALRTRTQVGVLPNGKVGIVATPPGWYRCGIEDPQKPGVLKSVAFYTYPDDFVPVRALLRRD